MIISLHRFKTDMSHANTKQACSAGTDNYCKVLLIGLHVNAIVVVTSKQVVNIHINIKRHKKYFPLYYRKFANL